MDETLNQSGESTIETAQDTTTDLNNTVDTNIQEDFSDDTEDTIDLDGNDYTKIPDEEFDEDGNWLNPNKDKKPEPEKIEETTTEETTTTTEPVKDPKTLEEWLTTFPEREVEIVKQELETKANEGATKFISMAKKYLAKASHPIITKPDGTQAYAEFTAEDVLNYCMKEGNYDAFLTLLSPLEVRNFIKEETEVNSKYDKIFQDFENEINVKSEYKEKKEETAKWNDYAKVLEKENPAIAHVLKKVATLGKFDKKLADLLTTAMKEGQALTSNTKLMSKQTDDIKKQMMGTAPVSTAKVNEFSQYKSINDVPDDVLEDPIKYKKMVAEFARRKRK